MNAKQFILPLFCSAMLIASGTAMAAPGGYPSPPPPGQPGMGPKPPVPPVPPQPPHMQPGPQRPIPPHMQPGPGPVPPHMTQPPKPQPPNMRPGPAPYPRDPRVINEWNWRVNELQRLRSLRPHNPMEAQRINENIRRLERDLDIMRSQYPWLR